MIFFLAFLLASMLGVSGYIAQVLGWISAISALLGMVVLAVLIYYTTMCHRIVSFSFTCLRPDHSFYGGLR